MTIRNISDILNTIKNTIHDKTEYDKTQDPCHLAGRGLTAREKFYIKKFINDKKSALAVRFSGHQQAVLKNIYMLEVDEILQQWDNRAARDLNYLTDPSAMTDEDKLFAFAEFLENDCRPGELTAEQEVGIRDESERAYSDLITALTTSGGCSQELQAIRDVECGDGFVKINNNKIYASAKVNEFYTTMRDDDAVPDDIDIDSDYIIWYHNGNHIIVPVGQGIIELLRYNLELLVTTRDDWDAERRDRILNKWAMMLVSSRRQGTIEEAQVTVEEMTKYFYCLLTSCTLPTNINDPIGDIPLDEEIQRTNESQVNATAAPPAAAITLTKGPGNVDFISDADDAEATTHRGHPCIPLPSNESFLYFTAIQLLNEIDNSLLLKKKYETLLKEIAFQLINEVSLDQVTQTPGKASQMSSEIGGGATSSSSGGGRARTQKKRETVFEGTTGGGNSNAARKAESEFSTYGTLIETDPALVNRIQTKYFPAAGISRSADPATTHWSAAFISFCTPHTGARHQTYMKKAKANRDRAGDDYQAAADAAKRDYFAFLPNEKSPVDGDICCRARDGDGDGWAVIKAKNHCDVFSDNHVIGGNRGSGKINKSSYNGSTYTMIISKGATITVPDDNS
jgi:hypothetical protein